MANTNIINAVFGSGICAVTTSAFRANYGMVLRFSGIDLPTAFEVDFSNYDVMGRDSITMIGQNNEVQIPDDLWDSGLNIYAYVYLHPTDDSGVTVYTVTIPVLGRPNRTEEQPTPHEQTLIEQAISALNDAVEQTAADVASADASASAAAQSEANASVSERSAAASASAALASQNAAESAAQSAKESASGASESARNAANSASQAAESATAAQESAEQAERSVQSIGDDVERAERAATTATGKATEASASAATASTKATQAEQSATAAAQSASSASTAAQNAASSATAAESSASAAEQAKQDAQAAQAAAEQAAESVSGLSEQIEQNTADIADLVQTKAGALIDTISGSIASFVPDATIPTVKGLSVDIEPVQDLHGYDNPWPAGGGKNKLPIMPFEQKTMNGVTAKYNDDGTITVNGTSTGRFYQYLRMYSEGWFPVGKTYTFKMYGLPDTASAAFLNFSYSDNGITYAGSYGTLTGNRTKTVTSSHQYNSVLFDVPEGQTFNNTKLYVYTEEGTTASDSWTPYSNICPISGWDSVEVTRTGKNLLKPYAYTKTQNGITFEESTDGSVRIYGTATASTWLNNSITGATMVFPVKAGTYRLSGNTVGNANGLNVYLVKMKGGTTAYDQGSGATITILEDDDVYLQVQVTSGKTIDATIYPQLELGSTATDFEPYQGETYTIQLGQTVYGCKIHATQGKMVVDMAMVDLGTLTYLMGTQSGKSYFQSNFEASFASPSWARNEVTPALCSIYKPISWSTIDAASAENSDFAQLVVSGGGLFRFYDDRYSDNNSYKAAMSGVQLVYELATPITVDLTPLEISVLTGQTNNIWADSGDVSVEYAADLKTYIDKKIAAAVAALS